MKCVYATSPPKHRAKSAFENIAENTTHTVVMHDIMGAEHVTKGRKGGTHCGLGPDVIRS